MPQSSRSRSTAPSSSPSVPPHLRQFLMYLAAERGLADNSLAAYRRDLEDIQEYLSGRKRTLARASADDLRGYLQSQSRKGQSTRTVARRLAAIRSFLRFQIGE